MTTQPVELSVSQARDHFSDAVNRATFGGEVTYVTRGVNKKRVVAIVPAEFVAEYEAMQDAEDIRIAQERLADIAAGRSQTISAAEVHQELGL